MRHATIIVVASLATTAHADKPVPDATALDALLKNETLVKQYGTVGWPLADEVSLDDSCTGEIMPVDVGFATYQQRVDNTAFNVGLAGTLALASDESRLGASMAVAPTIEMFDTPTFTPVGATLEAYTNSDGSSSFEIRTVAMGYVLGVEHQRAWGPLSYEWSFGYQLRESPINYVELFSPGVPCNGCAVGFEARTNVSHYVGGTVKVEASAAGIELRSLLAATSWADLDVHPFVHPWGYRERFPARVDLLGFVFAGRMQLLPRSDGTWIADAAAYVSVSDAMGGHFGMPLGELSPYVTLFDLVPLKHEKEIEYGCKLEPKFTPKS
jgi:hypothetical protein